MTTYTPTTWTDETPSAAVKYSLTDDSLGVLGASVAIAPVTSITPGTPLNAVNLNHMETGIANAQADANTANAALALIVPRYVKVRLNSSQLIPNNTYTLISFDTQEEDSHNIWAIGNPTKLIFPTAGIWSVGCLTEFDNNTAGSSREARLMKNGSGFISHSVWITPAISGSIITSTIERFAVSDYLEVHVWQNSGGNLNCILPKIWAHYIGA